MKTTPESRLRARERSVIERSFPAFKPASIGPARRVLDPTIAPSSHLPRGLERLFHGKRRRIDLDFTERPQVKCNTCGSAMAFPHKPAPDGGRIFGAPMQCTGPCDPNFAAKVAAEDAAAKQRWNDWFASLPELTTADLDDELLPSAS